MRRLVGVVRALFWASAALMAAWVVLSWVSPGVRDEESFLYLGAAMLVLGMLKSVGDQARGDQASKNARDGYMAEHLEIASYQLLERLAEKAGDQQTAEVARRNRSDEEEMARRIDASWDRALELTLEENDISTAPVSGVTDTAGGNTSTVTDTVGGATDSVRGATGNLLGGQDKQR